MTRMIVTAAITWLAATGCASPGLSVAPQARAQAIRMYVNGATPDEVAAELAIDPGTARAVIRAELRRLTRRLYGVR